MTYRTTPRRMPATSPVRKQATAPAVHRKPAPVTDMWGVTSNGARVTTVTELWSRRARYTLTTLQDPDAAYDIIRTEILRKVPPTDAALRERWDALTACITTLDAGLAPASADRTATINRLIDGMLSLCVAGAWR